MSTCNCDGTISQDISDYVSSLGSFSDVFGGVAPDTQATIACQTAVRVVRASGLNPCDEQDYLAQEFENQLSGVSQVVSTTPYQNPIQRTVDTAVGQQPAAPLAPTPPKPPQPANYLFIIGAIAILAIGFLLVFR